MSTGQEPRGLEPNREREGGPRKDDQTLQAWGGQPCDRVEVLGLSENVAGAVSG